MKTLNGKIVSTKMQKTAVVEIERRMPHPLYKKSVRKNKRYKVDSGDFTLSLGERVRIVEIKPVSKDKHFKIVEVLAVKREVKE